MSSIELFTAEDWRDRRDQVDAASRAWNPQMLGGLLQMVKLHHHDLSRLNAILQTLRSRGVEVVDGLARLLDDEEADVRIYAALALGESGSNAAIAPLMKALDDADTNVVQTAIEGLQKRHAREAVARLLDFLQADFFVAFSAVEALGVVGGGNDLVTDRLLALLDDDMLGEEAVRALGRLGTPLAVAPIARWLEAHRDQGESAMVALAAIHQSVGASLQSQVQETIRATVSRQTVLDIAGSSAVGPAVARAMALFCAWYLEDAPPTDRMRLQTALLRLVDHADSADIAIDALVRDGGDVLEALVRRLPHAESDTRCKLARALGDLRQAEAEPALVALLDADDTEVQIAALRALRDLRQAGCVPRLLECLGMSSPRVRFEAVAAVAACLPMSQLRLLTPLSTARDPRVRESVMRVLGDLPFAAVSWLLMLGLDDPQPSVRKYAVESMTRVIGENDEVRERIVALLTADPADVVRAAAARGLAAAAPDEARPLLARALSDRDPWTRLQACHALGRFKQAADRPHFLAACLDAEPVVRCAAAEALNGLVDDATIDALDRMLADPSEEVATAAATSLASTDNVRAVNALKHALRSHNGRRRGLLTAALSRASTPTARLATTPSEE